MNNSSHGQRDKASPPLEIPTREEQEAMKKVMMKLPQSNPEYMNTVMHIYRPPDPESKPKNLFFYGSLMDPDVIRVITETSNQPDMHKAFIRGFKLKMWGFYPTVIPGGAEDIVYGVHWQAANDRQLGLLQRYETHRYKLAKCSIYIEKDGKTTSIDDGITFVWAGHPGSSELKDGEFSLERYQLYFKPDAFNKKA